MFEFKLNVTTTTIIQMKNTLEHFTDMVKTACIYSTEPGVKIIRIFFHPRTVGVELLLEQIPNFSIQLY